MQEVTSFAIANGGIEFSEQKMLEFRDEALDILSDLPDNEYKSSLVNLVNYVVERKK